MKTTKRVSALLLALVLCLGMLPQVALAADSDFVIKDGVLTKYTGPGGDVVVPDGVTEIGYAAFYDCANLTSVTIPDGVTSIGKGAFNDCNNLTSIAIPDSVTYIGGYAFGGCSSLKSITLPKGIESINTYLFSDCKNLTDITIPDSVTSIEIGAFQHTGLTSVTIPNGVTSIGHDAFLSCENLTSITIPNSVTTMGGSVFFDCKSLTGVAIPDSVTSMGRGVFTNCRSLTSVTLPSGLTSIGDSMFNGCGKLTDITIPDTVTTISRAAFCGCSSLTSITIPDGVTTLEELAFAGCSGLTSVTFPDGLTSIGENAFSGCKSLTEIFFPKGLREIGNKAFYQCAGLTQVDLPTGLQTLGSDAFGSCPKLSQVNAPDSIQHLNLSAFAATPWLSEQADSDGFIIQDHTLIQYIGFGGDVVIPDGVTEVKADAFSGKTSLILSLTVPAGVTTELDLSYFKNLKKVTLKGKTKIARVWGCRYLADITPVENLVNIGSTLGFGDTPWYAEHRDENGFFIVNGTLIGYDGPGGHVVVPDTVTAIGDRAFYQNTSITALTVPDSVTQLGSFMCYQCANLKTVQLGRGITQIPRAAFCDADKLETINIPNTVEEICWMAFVDCDALNTVTFEKPISVKILGASWSSNLHPAGLTMDNCSAEFWAAYYQNSQELWFNPGQLIEPQSERIRSFSNQITAGCETDYEKAKAINDWVCENIRYDSDYYRKHTKPLEDVTTMPEKVLDSRLTICAGYAKLVQALLLAQNIPAYYVNGKGKNDGHAWNEVYVDGRWMLLDATWGKIYFDMPAARFAQSHFEGIRMLGNGSWYVAPAEEDVPSQWAQSEVWDAIWTSKLIPNDLQAAYRSNITREEFCRIMITLLERQMGKTMEEYLASKGLTLSNPFADTDNEAVLAAYALGIVNGTSATTFNPNGFITRQEAATMLARTATVLGLIGDNSLSFRDEDQMDNWARENVAFVSGLVDPTTGNRVMGGVAEDLFAPLGTYTREQAILTALRLFRCAD